MSSRRPIVMMLGAFAGAWLSQAVAADVVYTYDALGRLVQVVYPSGKTITYVYDAAGNLTSVTVTP